MLAHTVDAACLADLAERTALGDHVVAETGGLDERSLLGDRFKGIGGLLVSKAGSYRVRR